jgi:hypothetical protein
MEIQLFAKLDSKIFLFFVVHSPYSPSTEYDNMKLGKAYYVTCVTPDC